MVVVAVGGCGSPFCLSTFGAVWESGRNDRAGQLNMFHHQLALHDVS